MALSPPPSPLAIPSPPSSPIPPMTSVEMPCLPPHQVWITLPLLQQTQVRQTLIALLQDVSHDPGPV